MSFRRNVFIIFIFLFCGNATASIINGDFSNGLAGWTKDNVGGFTPEVSSFSGFTSPSARIFSSTSCAQPSGCGNVGFSAGFFGSISQTIDLTGVNSIEFDFALTDTGFLSGIWQSFLVFEVLIDSTVVLSQTGLGDYSGQSIDTSALSGASALTFKLSAISSGLDRTSNWAFIDNVSLTVTDVSAPGVFSLLCLCGSMMMLRKRVLKM